MNIRKSNLLSGCFFCYLLRAAPAVALRPLWYCFCAQEGAYYANIVLCSTHRLIF